MPTLDFKGKSLVYSHHLIVPARTLEPDAKKSLPLKGSKASLDDNLTIHGDNLHALKALMPRYAGKIKCIYIDPPYNTGNEGWVYNDNVNSPMMQEWLKDRNPVDGEDLERHDKWLCMMWPRLHLLRELLAEDGVIFISIDDNEHHRLQMVMDEIFGEQNFVGKIIWRNVSDNNPTNISIEHEYVTCYAASKERLESVWQSIASPIKQKLIEIGNKYITEYSDPKERQRAYSKWLRENKMQLRPLDRYKYIDDQGIYTGSQSVHNPGREGYRYDVIHPKTKRPCKQPLMGYRFPPETMNAMLKRDEILFGKDENKLIEIKLYARDYSAKLPSVIELDTRVGAYEIKNIFPQVTRAFDFPKPSQLIREIIAFATNKDSIVLDSFAGTGTTAHAVLSLNQEDSGNRKFILVECEDYADKITAERVRRVIKGMPKAKDENLKTGLGGSFTYCTLGDEISPEKMLTGENLPDYETLARHLVYTATGQAPDKIRNARDKDGFFYESSDRLFYLIYQPDLTFLRSPDSALNSDRAERIAKQVKKKQKTAVVFATHKFMGQKELTQMGITFCGLPYGTGVVD